jgi:hypothetical protein
LPLFLGTSSLKRIIFSGVKDNGILQNSGKYSTNSQHHRTSALTLQVLVSNTFLNMLASVNPLQAELNPICPLLVLLRDLMFMGPCFVSIFQYISDKMQSYTICLYLETVLHVSGCTFTHHQERKQLYLQHLVFVTPLLLSAAIVEELELV